MSLGDIQTRKAVEQAMAEFRSLGRARFLEKYGFGKSREYFLSEPDQLYDSKAIVGAAHGYEFPAQGPLKSGDFSGGANTVVPKLEALGFSILRRQFSVVPGDVLSNTDLQNEFGVSSQGGMRRSRKNNCLVLISNETKSLYHDRWEDDILHYTGEGLSGNQRLIRQNRTLADSPQSDISVHLFEVFEQKKYVYAGEAELAGEPYLESQVDQEGVDRQVIMFPLRLKPGGQKPRPSPTNLRSIETTRERALEQKSLDELKTRAGNAKTNPEKRTVTGTQIIRDAAIVAYVKKAAQGLCDLCGLPAPFENKKGQPYLECHHVIRLADGGSDAIENAVALCANCHRRMHILDLKSDRRKLFARIQARDAQSE